MNSLLSDEVIRLEPMRVNDANNLTYLEMVNSPEITQFLSGLGNKKLSSTDLAELIKNYDGQLFKIYSKEYAFIGTIGLSNIDKIERDCSFGIAIHPKFHNHKFGKRAIWIMLEYIFTDLDLDRVHLTVLENNEKAKKIYKSFGFSQEGIAPDPVLKNGKYFNLEIFVLLRSNYAREEVK